MRLATPDDEKQGIRRDRPEALPSLTGIRGVAAVWVMLRHVTWVLHLKAFPGSVVLVRGWSGVDLFFVLSGFILMHAHARDFAQSAASNVGRYAWGRFVRIYPLTFVVAVLITGIALTNHDRFAWIDFHGSLGLNFLAAASILTIWFPQAALFPSPVWSLSAELVGYLFLPLIAFGLARTKRSAAIIAVAAFGALAAAQIYLHEVDQNIISTGSALMRMGCCFVAGAALRQLRPFVPSQITRWTGTISGAALACILACCFWKVGAEAQPALYGLLILSLSYRQGWVDRLLSSPPMLFLGKISFPLYLTHLAILYYVSYARDEHWIKGTFATLGIFFVASFAVASILHWCVEKPTHRLSRRGGTRPARAIRALPTR